MKEKQSFVVYYEWEEMLQFMTDSQIAEILRAMFSYAKRGKTPEFSSPLLNTTFCVIKYAIDRDSEAYANRCKKNSENIAKRWNDTKYDGIPKIQSYTKHTDNDNDNDNDNGNGNDKENILPTASPPAVKDRATEGAYTEDFLDFWEKYPRKTGKGAAFRAWLKIRPTKKERADIVSALKWQKHSEQWTTEYGKFIPLPATYLNQRRWEDEPNGLCMGDITDPNRYKDDESDIEALRLLEEYVNGIN